MVGLIILLCVIGLFIEIVVDGLVRVAKAIRGNSPSEEFSEQMGVAKSIMHKRQSVLRKLAN